jgi:serine/threonine protein kinase
MKSTKHSPEKDEICPTCGKRIAEDSHAGSLTSYLFQSLNCSCGKIDDRLMPDAGLLAKSNAGSQSKDSLGSLGSFCQICGLQNYDDGVLGSITGFLFQDTRCKCPAEHMLSGDGMAERFWKLREAEVDRVFASVTRDVLNEQGKTRTSINLLPGTIIGGNYRIVALLGKGGMGEVYLAQQLSLAKNCALKVIPPDQVTDLSWQRFQNEAKTIGSLEHINLVKVTDLGLHEGCLPYYAMEHIDGQSLMDRLKAGGPLPLKTVLDVFMQVCDGVHHAHRKGVVHRDLKPANIMLIRSPGDKFLVKILDFGLVKLTEKDRHQQSLTKAGEIFGTPFYMSPEQCTGGKIDSRSDVYSIGCTMFEALTGYVPFKSASAIETITFHQTADPPSLESMVGANVFPVALEVVMAKLLRKNPVERYQTLLELRGDLERVTRGEDVEPYYISRTKRPQAQVQAERERVDRIPRSATQTRASKTLRLSRRLALGAGFVAVAAIGIAASQFFARPAPGPSASALTEQQNLLEKEKERQSKRTVAKVVPASVKDTAPFSTIVEKNGRQWRVFQFPDDAIIGKIYGSRSASGEAWGKVEFPAEEHVTFLPKVDAVKFPPYLKRFRAGDIYTAEMSKYAGEFDQGSTEACLKAMISIPGVQCVDLRNSDDLSTSEVGLLSGFTSIKSLVLGKIDLDIAALSKLAILKNLESLSMSGHYSVSPVLLALRNSKSMKSLSLPASSLTLDDAALIASLANLERLHLDQIEPNDADTTSRALHILSKNTKLQELSIRKLIVHPETIIALKAFRNLKMLRSYEVGDAVSGTVIRRLFKDFPHLELGPPYVDSGKLPKT